MRTIILTQGQSALVDDEDYGEFAYTNFDRRDLDLDLA